MGGGVDVALGCSFKWLLSYLHRGDPHGFALCLANLRFSYSISPVFSYTSRFSFCSGGVVYFLFLMAF